MNVDGYALIQIHDKDSSKGTIDTIRFFDFLLDNADFEEEEILDGLLNDPLQYITDSLVMCYFTYRSVTSYDSYHGVTEFEDVFHLVSYQVVQTGYKEFSRIQILKELNACIGGLHNLKMMTEEEDTNYYRETVSDWEEFYEENLTEEAEDAVKSSELDASLIF